jgi:hypothetical protein
MHPDVVLCWKGDATGDARVNRFSTSHNHQFARGTRKAISSNLGQLFGPERPALWQVGERGTDRGHELVDRVEQRELAQAYVISA